MNIANFYSFLNRFEDALEKELNIEKSLDEMVLPLPPKDFKRRPVLSKFNDPISLNIIYHAEIALALRKYFMNYHLDIGDICAELGIGNTSKLYTISMYPVVYKTAAKLMSDSESCIARLTIIDKNKNKICAPLFPMVDFDNDDDYHFIVACGCMTDIFLDICEINGMGVLYSDFYKELTRIIGKLDRRYGDALKRRCGISENF